MVQQKLQKLGFISWKAIIWHGHKKKFPWFLSTFEAIMKQKIEKIIQV
jgi:hypothetical protein